MILTVSKIEKQSLSPKHLQKTSGVPMSRILEDTAHASLLRVVNTVLINLVEYWWLKLRKVHLIHDEWHLDWCEETG